MTVGKIIDTFTDNNIVAQIKETKDSAGRKANLIKLNPDRYCSVIDLTTYNFTITIIDFCLNYYNKLTCSYNNDYDYKDNLYIFFKNIQIYLLKQFTANARFFGTGVILPGSYNRDADIVTYDKIPEFDNINIISMIENVMQNKIDQIDIDADAVARSLMNTERYIKNSFSEKIIIYINIAKNNDLHSAIIINGQVIKGASSEAGNINDILLREDIKFQNSQTKKKKFDPANNEFLTLLYILIQLINPHVIILESEDFRQNSDIENNIYEKLKNDFKLKKHMIPEIIAVVSLINHAHRGQAVKLRDKWFEDNFLTL
jgi:predicted NBD/HSP70 family sugar kinase